MAAVIYNGRPPTPEVVVDETWFSNPNFCKEAELWYAFAKTSVENNIDMVVINPAMTVGPLLQPELNSSAALIFNLINGSQTFPNATFGWINVKDVANAHIQAYEIGSASGRYIVAERVAHMPEIAKILRDIYPTLQIAEKCADDKPFMPTYQASKEKTKNLGIEFIPLDVSLS